MFVVSPVAATRMLHHSYDLFFYSCSLSFCSDMCLGSVVTISLFIITVVSYFLHRTITRSGRPVLSIFVSYVLFSVFFG